MNSTSAHYNASTKTKIQHKNSKNSKNTKQKNNNNNNKIGGTGIISKSFRKYVSNILGNHEDKELQKTVILGTAHILRKVLT
jgi:hypothetical protein